MRYWLYLGVWTLFFSACQTERYQKREIIKGMEQAAAQNTNDAVLRPLIANYLDYTMDYQDDAKTPIYLYRVAVLYYRARNYGEAAVHLERILAQYPETPILEEAYLLLASMEASSSGNAERAAELYRSYLEQFPQGKGVAEAEYYFLPESEKLQDQIDALIAAINGLPRGQEPTEDQLLQLIFSYAEFINTKPENPLSASYALEAARLAIRVEQHLIAVQLLEYIYHEAPNFDRRPEAMLLLAVEYDTNLTLYIRQDNLVSSQLTQHLNKEDLPTLDPIARGKALYEEILAKYPDHEVAASAQAGLKNLGKKTEEVVEEFLRQQDSIRLAE